MVKKFIGILVCAILISVQSSVFATEDFDYSAVNEEIADADYMAVYEATIEYINGLGTPDVGSVGGEWMVIDLTRSGYDCPEGYYDNVVAYVEENINDKEQLHRAKSTDNSRVILALTSAGYDVTDVGGHNLLKGLSDMAYLKKQGINGPIWALIALDSHNYDIPQNENEATQATREDIISHILSKQFDDGGWAISGGVADPDMTGMAIQSLAPYYDTNPEVMSAVDRALQCLSDIQHDNGAYGSFDGLCSESCVQVLVALTSLGIDPEADERFIKNGISVVDALCMFAVDGGGFEHIPYGGLNGMATEQGQYGLASYVRFLEGMTSLYDMTDVAIDGVDVWDDSDIPYDDWDEEYTDESYYDEWEEPIYEDDVVQETDVPQYEINEELAKNIFADIKIDDWHMMRVLAVSKRRLLSDIIQRDVTLFLTRQ